MGFFNVLRNTAVLPCRRLIRATNASLKQPTQLLGPSLLATASFTDLEVIYQVSDVFCTPPACSSHTTGHLSTWKRLIDAATTAETGPSAFECLEDATPCDDIPFLPTKEAPPLILNTEQGYRHIAVGLSHAVEYEEVKVHAIDFDDEDDDDYGVDQDEAPVMQPVHEAAPVITAPPPLAEEVIICTTVESPVITPITPVTSLVVAPINTPARPRVIRDDTYYAKMWATRHVAWTPVEGEVAAFDAASIQALRAARLAVDAQPAKFKDSYYGC